MSRLTLDGTAEPVSRDQILRHVRGQESIHFPCSADHEPDWQPYPVDPYSAVCGDHTYRHIHIYISVVGDVQMRDSCDPVGVSDCSPLAIHQSLSELSSTLLRVAREC